MSRVESKGAVIVDSDESKRNVVVRLELPFALEHRGRPEREQVVGWDRQRTTAYLEALRREIASNAGEFADCQVKAVRLGGGIATNAPADELWKVCKTLRESLNLAKDTPMSARASICNVSGASMPYLRRAGVTRFDFELLALDSSDFCRLNHTDAIQDLGYIEDSFLHAYANKTLGVVLAYGYDAPDTRSFRRTIVQFTRMPAHHLILEPWKGPGVPQASAELAAAQLAEANDVLTKAGFVEYAPHRFARPGDEDPFWALQSAGGRDGDGATEGSVSASSGCEGGGTHGCEVLGFGLGATTRFDGVESTNTADWDTYVQFAGDFTKITASVRKIEG